MLRAWACTALAIRSLVVLLTLLRWFHHGVKTMLVAMYCVLRISVGVIEGSFQGLFVLGQAAEALDAGLALVAEVAAALVQAVKCVHGRAGFTQAKALNLGPPGREAHFT